MSKETKTSPEDKNAKIPYEECKAFFSRIELEKEQKAHEIVLGRLRAEVPMIGGASTHEGIATVIRGHQQAHYRAKKLESHERHANGEPRPLRAKRGEGRNQVPVADAATRAIVRICQTGIGEERHDAIRLLETIKAPVLMREWMAERGKRLDVAATKKDRQDEVWHRTYEAFRSVIATMPVDDDRSFSDRFDGRVHDALRADQRASRETRDVEHTGSRIPTRSALRDDAAGDGPDETAAPARIDQLPDSHPSLDSAESILNARILDELVVRGALDPDDRELFKDFHFEGLTHAECAARRNISEAASRKRVDRINEIVARAVADATTKEALDDLVARGVLKPEDRQLFEDFRNAGLVEDEFARRRNIGKEVVRHRLKKIGEDFAKAVTLHQSSIRAPSREELRVHEKAERKRRHDEKKKRESALAPSTLFTASPDGSVGFPIVRQLLPQEVAAIRCSAMRAGELEVVAKNVGYEIEVWCVDVKRAETTDPAFAVGWKASPGEVFFLIEERVIEAAVRIARTLVARGEFSIQNTPITETPLRDANWREKAFFKRTVEQNEAELLDPPDP